MVVGPGSRVTELETVVRTDFTDATKMLHGPFFVPARVQHALPRDELALWGRELFEQLGRDWAHLRFTLRCRGTDELAVAFDLPAPAPHASVSPIIPTCKYYSVSHVVVGEVHLFFTFLCNHYELVFM